MNRVPAWIRNIGPGVLIFCAAVLAYLPALPGAFIWNDSDYVTAPALRSLDGLGRIWAEPGATQQYYPLLHTAFWVQCLLFGDHPLGYHIVTLLLHAASAVLFALFLRRLGCPGAWLAGLIFALHPVHVESVAWIAEQKNTLSLVFYLAAALVYVRFDETRRPRTYVAALGLFALSLLSKTVTATLPAALLVVLWWKRGRLDWRRDFLPLLPWLALGAAAGLFSSWVETRYVGAHGADFVIPFPGRLLIAGRAVWFYAGKFFWPFGLNFIYSRWTVDPATWQQWLHPLGVLVAGAGFWALRRRTRALLAAFLFFAGSLFPVLGFVNLYGMVYSWVWDHWQYLPDLGLSAFAAAGLVLAWDRAAIRLRWTGPALVAALALGLGALTWDHCRMFRDDETLYRATIARNPDCWMAHNNLGMILARIPGRLPEAMSEYETALRIKPDHPEAHVNRGNVLAHIPGRLPEAIAEYEAALQIQPDHPEAHYNLGIALAKIPGRLPETIVHFEAALKGEPGSAEIHNNMGIALAQIPGRLPEALAEYEAALALKPDYPEAHNNLGIALAQIPGRLPEAVARFEAAIQIKPDYPEAHFNLGMALARSPGRLPDAIAQYEEALRIQPDYVEAHLHLGMALAHIPGRLPDAIAQYEEALRIQPDHAQAHINLGVALAQTPGRLAEATAQFEAALRIQPDYPEAHFNLGNALLEMPGRQQEALAHFEAALRMRPDWERARQKVDQLRAVQP